MSTTDTSRLPLIWPSAAQAGGVPKGADWFASLELGPNTVRSISGIVAAVDHEGVGFVSRLLAACPTATCRLLLLLAPGASPQRELLLELLELQTVSSGRVHFRLKTSRGETPTALCIVMEQTHEAIIFNGASPNFGLGPRPSKLPNLVLKADSRLVQVWGSWFEDVWGSAAALTQEAAHMPRFLPTRVDPEAKRVWQEYERYLDAMGTQDESTSMATSTIGLIRERSQVQPQTQAQAKPPDGVDQSRSEPVSVAEDLGLDVAVVADRIKALYPKGLLVTIDKLSRLPPLDCPLKPEWFGAERNQTVGSITKTTGYRISALSKKDLGKLEAKRNGLTSILPRFTYLLSDGMRWIPVAALPLLYQEMDRIQQSAKDYLGNILRGNLDGFVQSQRPQIKRSVNQFLQQEIKGAEVDDFVLDQIMEIVKGRLESATNRRFLPSVVPTPIQVPQLVDGDHVSGWGQPFQFLLSVAQYAREMLTDSYFIRGLSIEQEKLISAMNVLDDHIWRERRSDWASHELGIIGRIRGADATQYQKYRWLFDLIDGKGREVERALPSTIIEE